MKQEDKLPTMIALTPWFLLATYIIWVTGGKW